MVDRDRALVVLGVLALLGAAACGATTSNVTESTSGDDRGSTSSDDGSAPTVSAAHATCPESYAGAPAPSCREGDDPGTCTYPEGTCDCSVPTWCGGMAPPPRPPVWTCQPARPACPSAGTPCDADGQSCALGPCGFDHVVCTDGVWRVRVGPRPP